MLWEARAAGVAAPTTRWPSPTWSSWSWLPQIIRYASARRSPRRHPHRPPGLSDDTADTVEEPQAKSFLRQFSEPSYPARKAVP